MMGYYSAVKTTCGNMDVPWKHHAKWEQAVATDHILYDLIYVKSPEETQKVDLVVAQGWEGLGDCQQGGG